LFAGGEDLRFSKHAVGVVCGVWCVECGVWCVVCGVWCEVCDVIEDGTSFPKPIDVGGAEQFLDNWNRTTNRRQRNDIQTVVVEYLRREVNHSGAHLGKVEI
jgi:hypothetical protein